MAKSKAQIKITQEVIDKYHLCEHHKVGYQEVEKLCKKQDKDIRRQDKVIEKLAEVNNRQSKKIEFLETSKENWIKQINEELLNKVKNTNQSLQAQKEFYEKEIEFLNEQYDKAIETNRELVKTNQENIEVNKKNQETYKDLMKQHNEITRAYNGLHSMGKFAGELGIDIKKHNAMLPENNKDYEFSQKHTLLESGKVQHQWTLKKKKKEAEDGKK